MGIILDEECNEITALLKHVSDIADKRVLEIGCGDGRLTWRYAGMASEVTGIDPNLSRLQRARENLPLELKDKVRFYSLALEDYLLSEYKVPLDPAFDLVILSWSL